MEGTDFDERYSLYVDNLLHKTNFKSRLKDAHFNFEYSIKNKISEKGYLFVVISLSIVIGFFLSLFLVARDSENKLPSIILFILMSICAIVAVDFFNRFERQIISYIYKGFFLPKAFCDHAFQEQTSEILSLAADIHRIHGLISITGNAMIDSRSHELSEDEISSLSTILTFANELVDVEKKIQKTWEYKRYTDDILNDFYVNKEVIDYIEHN